MQKRAQTTGYRRESLWRAAMIHRVSGVLLACFLPLHFLALGLAIEGEAKLDGFFRWAQQPLVKLAEFGLVFLLAVHLLGGLRLFVVENLPWRVGQKAMAKWAIVTAAGIALVFLLLVLA